MFSRAREPTNPVRPPGSQAETPHARGTGGARLRIGCGNAPRPVGVNRYAAASRCAASLQEPTMTLHLSLAPLIALLAGILILVRPKLLATIVAVYLIIVGVLGLFPGLGNVF